MRIFDWPGLHAPATLFPRFSGRTSPRRVCPASRTDFRPCSPLAGCVPNYIPPVPQFHPARSTPAHCQVTGDSHRGVGSGLLRHTIVRPVGAECRYACCERWGQSGLGRLRSFAGARPEGYRVRIPSSSAELVSRSGFEHMDVLFPETSPSHSSRGRAMARPFTGRSNDGLGAR